MRIAFLKKCKIFLKLFLLIVLPLRSFAASTPLSEFDRSFEFLINFMGPNLTFYEQNMAMRIYDAVSTTYPASVSKTRQILNDSWQTIATRQLDSSQGSRHFSTLFAFASSINNLSLSTWILQQQQQFDLQQLQRSMQQDPYWPIPAMYPVGTAFYFATTYQPSIAISPFIFSAPTHAGSSAGSGGQQTPVPIMTRTSHPISPMHKSPPGVIPVGSMHPDPITKPSIPRGDRVKHPTIEKITLMRGTIDPNQMTSLMERSLEYKVPTEWVVKTTVAGVDVIFGVKVVKDHERPEYLVYYAHNPALDITIKKTETDKEATARAWEQETFPCLVVKKALNLGSRQRIVNCPRFFGLNHSAKREEYEYTKFFINRAFEDNVRIEFPSDFTDDIWAAGETL